MPRYSAIVEDHLAAPRNAGRLEAPDRVGRADNEACGDVLELQLALEGERIVAAGFMASGCAPALAAGSALTELLLGRSLSDAATLDPAAIEAALGGLPAGKRHVTRLACDALASALADRRT